MIVMMDDGDGDDVNDETYYILNTSAACASARSQMYAMMMMATTITMSSVMMVTGLTMAQDFIHKRGLDQAGYSHIGALLSSASALGGNRRARIGHTPSPNIGKVLYFRFMRCSSSAFLARALASDCTIRVDDSCCLSM